MRDSLPVQAALAPDFVSRAWPAVLEQARRHLTGRVGKVTNLLVCGCGDSHAAVLGAELGLRLWSGRRVRSASSLSAARYLPDEINASCLMIGVSSSGEVARTVEALEQGRQAHARTVALTCTPGSALANEADAAIVVDLPEHPLGPGLLSYLGALLGLMAVGASMASEARSRRLSALVTALPARMAESAVEQNVQGRAFAERVADATHGVFVGGGPAFGAAGFAAAKVIEACGLDYHAQDIEEWAHLEYFASPAQSPVWLLTAGGRDTSRVAEVEVAARAIGRRVEITRWNGSADWSDDEREALAPFGLWSAPVAFAHRLMEILGEEPFRAFGGGRSRAEGGGPSRIRTSQRLAAGRRTGVP